MVPSGGARWLRLLCVSLLLTLVPLTLVPPAAAGGERVKSGTGFFVSREGFLVTSAHVVTGCPRVSVWGQDHKEHTAYVVASDRQLDVALLRGEGTRARQVAATGRDLPRVGEAVFTLGLGVIPTDPLRGVPLSGALVGTSVEEQGHRILVLHAVLHAGYSGAAVVDEDGSLVGMVIGRDEHHDDLGVALAKDDIEPLLRAYGIKLADERPMASPGETLSAISALVQCPVTRPNAQRNGGVQPGRR